MIVGYMLFWGLVNNKLVEHSDRNGMICDYQAGFTGGMSLVQNLFIVRYCIEETYWFGRKLVEVSIDFKKAFNSVERMALVRTLKYYKCDPNYLS